MTLNRDRSYLGGLLLVTLLTTLVAGGQAQQPPQPAQAPPGHDHGTPGAGGRDHGPAGTAEDPGKPGARSHEPHGTPPDWRFSWPAGNPVKGRAVFAKLACWTCHPVNGEKFPAPRSTTLGPELSSMADHHEAAFFAEAIINPSAVVDQGHGWAGPDGSSRMPDFNDSMTVRDAIDLVAYLKSLGGGRTGTHQHGPGRRLGPGGQKH